MQRNTPVLIPWNYHHWKLGHRTLPPLSPCIYLVPCTIYWLILLSCSRLFLFLCLCGTFYKCFTQDEWRLYQPDLHFVSSLPYMGSLFWWLGLLPLDCVSADDFGNPMRLSTSSTMRLMFAILSGMCWLEVLQYNDIDDNYNIYKRNIDIILIDIIILTKLIQCLFNHFCFFLFLLST